MSDTAPVFLVDAVPSSGHTVLDGPEGRHAAAVRRLQPGEELVIADGRGAAAACVVETVQGKESLGLHVQRSWTEPQPQPRIVLAQALIKGDRGELAVELATETGVDVIVPWRSGRSIVKWEDGPRGAKALARWRSTAREAAKQSRRAWIPEVTEAVTTRQLVDLIRKSAVTVLLDAAAEAGIRDITMPTEGDLVLVVGPEGGISESESETLRTAGAQVARLGPTVLRASTAAAVAIAALGVLTPRWR
ncbi:16S rRNA (uracil(1498)-N(3))-methyltransferase [Actinophytocola oryzae]|uniref:Ribosomal RNA small subunit methyltransferase E n=1 Tax=Actinophytocola oryzae TaxID=502181 RepID=A0A4R7VVS8_9PSEU|nr:16S rRNA (uracil(1498)-N(3))-methyltransferase [Actinophytocola oryzae]TDV54130.1 16S rRNA (uracil1498-N3)-methyltransferase [Actinophytocola oryzae]